jgi:nicotinamidase-related amidase
MSAFDGTPLATSLRDLGVGTLAIVGAVLETGIEPTVRDARELGLVPSLLSDACYTFLELVSSSRPRVPAAPRSGAAWRTS